MRQLPSNLVLEWYQNIEGTISDAKNYVSQWLKYQSLWDLNPESLYASLGNDLEQWHFLVMEIKEARSLIESSDESQHFGPLVIHHVRHHSVMAESYIYRVLL